MENAEIGRLSRLGTSSSISFPTKYRLYQSPLVFILVLVLLNGCVIRTETECRIQSLRRLLRITYIETYIETNE